MIITRTKPQHPSETNYSIIIFRRNIPLCFSQIHLYCILYLYKYMYIPKHRDSKQNFQIYRLLVSAYVLIINCLPSLFNTTVFYIHLTNFTITFMYYNNVFMTYTVGYEISTPHEGISFGMVFDI